MPAPIVNPSWPEFVEHQADLERAERTASRESQPTFVLPAKSTNDDVEFVEKYDAWMAKRLKLMVEELRESRVRARAKAAKELTASECEIEIVDEL